MIGGAWDLVVVVGVVRVLMGAVITAEIMMLTVMMTCQGAEDDGMTP
jgi:hypothetical protein